MAESLKQDRIVFSKKGAQKEFLLKVSLSIDLNWKQLSNIIGVHDRTLRDWVNEKFRMPHLTAQALSKKASIPLPKDIEIIKWKQYLMSASRKGGIAKYKKYGNVGGSETKRKKAWEKWWVNEGKFKKQPIFERKQICKPRESIALAEFTGIMIGDGGISEYHITVTLNSKDDYEYSIFVCKLIEKLFNVFPKIYKKKDSLAIDIVIHRKELVEFCKSIGLKVGNKLKQGLDIPQWIKNDKRYSIACVRGLVDTDGSIFTHKYKVNGKEYSYKKLSFTTMSKSLLCSVSCILKEVGIKSRVSSNRDVRIESVADMKKYFHIFGTSNPKHLKRYGN